MFNRVSTGLGISENLSILYLSPVLVARKKARQQLLKLHAMHRVGMLRGGVGDAVLDELTGERASEAVVSEVFSQFCVGK